MKPLISTGPHHLLEMEAVENRHFSPVAMNRLGRVVLLSKLHFVSSFQPGLGAPGIFSSEGAPAANSDR
jgi:hypothetical protein